MGYDPSLRKKLGVINKASGGKIRNDDRSDWREAWVLFSGDVAYVWHADKKGVGVGMGLIEQGFELRAQIIWVKSGHILGRGNYHNMHEPCWYAMRKSAHWCGARDQDTVWKIAKQRQGDDKQTEHGTQKPVEVMRRPILNHTKKGESVYDPFLGSGTTMIAAESTGRVCYGIDIDSVYVDVAVKRWQEYTGENATLENDGRSFDEVVEERTVPIRKRTRV